jgi:hypothetical protein
MEGIEMPKQKPAADITAAAETRITQARDRFVQTGIRRRELQAAVAAAEEAIGAELYAAGQDGRDPQGIEEQRAQIVQWQQQLVDLDRLEEGQDRAIRDAIGARDQVELEHAPMIEAELLALAESLQTRRAEAETLLASVAAEEEALRERWRHLEEIIPGAEATFGGGETAPKRLPTSLHPAQTGYIGEPSWPSGCSA